MSVTNNLYNGTTYVKIKNAATLFNKEVIVDLNPKKIRIINREVEPDYLDYPKIKNDIEKNMKNVFEISALNFLDKKGYKIISYSGKTETYGITKEKLKSEQYGPAWGMLDIEISKYIGKSADVLKFLVKNHPLDKQDNNFKNQTYVWVIVIDGEPIGGYSLPDLYESSYGGVYSLNGKTWKK